MNATTRPTTHEFQPDMTLPTDHNGRRTCLCGLPRRHQRHEVPDVDPEVRAADARRLGERNTDE
jgi:hypothetical protein